VIEREIFDRFFTLSNVSVGPEIISNGVDGNWLGSVIFSKTQKNILIKHDFCIIGIREFNNSCTEEFYSALNYLSIQKSELDKFVNQIYLMEWEILETSKKPNIDNLRRRAYL